MFVYLFNYYLLMFTLVEMVTTMKTSKIFYQKFVVLNVKCPTTKNLIDNKNYLKNNMDTSTRVYNL